MTLRRQLLLLLLVHLIVGLAAWDGYRLGLRRGRAERLRPQTSIIDDTPQVDFDSLPPGECMRFDSKTNKLVPYQCVPQPPNQPGREQWDVNWRLN